MEVDEPSSTTGTTTMSSAVTGAVMTEEAQKERRNSIRDILADETLTAIEKRRSIQSLMDGRRRSSGGTHRSSSSSNNNDGINEMHRAAEEAAEFYNSSFAEHDTMSDYPMASAGSAASTASLTSQNSDDNAHHGAAPPGAVEDYQKYNYNTTMNNNTNGNPFSGSHHVSHHQQQQHHQHQQFQRRGRSASLPAWSDNSMQAVAPLAAAINVWDDPINVNRRMEKSRPACQHYERNCTIISPCCGLGFGCRICHDESPVLPVPFHKRQNRQSMDPNNNAQAAWSEKKDIATGGKSKQEKRRSLPLGFDEEETHHEIDRFAIQEVICRLCYVRQSSKSNNCIACGVRFGAYHCNICNLWMSDDESPYHCSDCGFCRVGGRENFRHCDDCGMCIDTLLFDDHNCKAGKYMSNCPVCQEDLFSSRDASHEMPCGHAIHWHCFKELTSYDTRCPVCKKTAETPEHMAPTWQAMAMGIALQPVPPELARVVTIMCNDCEVRDTERRWHFLGVRCLTCMSFNTTIERTTMTGREAASFLDDLELQQGTRTMTSHQYNGGTFMNDPMDE